MSSDFLPCNTKVPQGSNLGPLFFSIYFDDLMYQLECQAENYAYDRTLMLSAKSTAEISSKIIENCKNVCNWMKANMLKMNADKTHILIAGTRQRTI